MLHCHQLVTGIINLLAGHRYLTGSGGQGIKLQGKCKGPCAGGSPIAVDADRSRTAVRIGTADKFQRAGIIGQHHICIGKIAAAGYLHIDLDLASHGSGRVRKCYFGIGCKCSQHLGRHHDCNHTCHNQDCNPLSHSSYHHLFLLSDYHVFSVRTAPVQWSHYFLPEYCRCRPDRNRPVRRNHPARRNCLGLPDCRYLNCLPVTPGFPCCRR